MTGPTLPLTRYRRFESFKEYETLFDTLLSQTESIVRVFDNALPIAWNSAQRTTLLRQFLLRNPANRLYVILHDVSTIEHKLPRLVELNRNFTNAFKIRNTPQMARHLYDPFAIFDASHYLHRFHYAHMRAAIGIHDVDETQTLLDRYLELWEASKSITVGAPGGL